MIDPVTAVITEQVEAERAVVLFADLSGFTVLTELRGDSAAADVAIRFLMLARASLTGVARLLKALGDGVLIVAPDWDAAQMTALGLRERLLDEPELLPVRIGICEGPVVWREGDVFGATVNNAARLADAAEPWEIRECSQPSPVSAVSSA
jgi:adenylate cyclase